jgi:hypothetical protein
VTGIDLQLKFFTSALGAGGRSNLFPGQFLLLAKGSLVPIEWEVGWASWSLFAFWRREKVLLLSSIELRIVTSTAQRLKRFQTPEETKKKKVAEVVAVP